jgi:hypothetical protein
MKKLFCVLILLTYLLKPQASKVGEEVNANLETSKEQSAQIASYNGKVYHIFFHSLILYPELAFSGKKASQYNDWMTTRKEFKVILDKLYENDFVLADIDEIRTAKISGKPFMFPKGKKPLIISVDDVNYYDYMKNDGFAEKLIVDENGMIANLVRTPQNKYIIDYEGDVAPILDRFVALHPDFSYKGAKGILAVTGFQGVFGYRTTTLQGEELKVAKIKAKEVAQTLKSKGWKIACHSYTHSSKFKDGSISMEKLKADIQSWQTHIAPIVGTTNIFIAPFGTQFATNGKQFQLFVDNGYNIYCSVCKKMNTSVSKNCLISERLNFDGFTMLKYPSRITECFFELDEIIDPMRSKISV